MSVDGFTGIYYYTPLPLNLAKKQQASSKQQASTSSFYFAHSLASSLGALLYPIHLGA